MIDTPQESNNIDKQKISMPPVQGKVIFEDVVFSFTNSKTNILDKVSLKLTKVNSLELLEKVEAEKAP